MCAKPASPLGEKHIFENQSVKLGIEGNMNETVRQSSSAYSVSGGKFFAHGQEREFSHGFHNWPPAK